MCINNLESDKKEIAEEDITVLKVIKRNKKGKLCSPIFDTEIWEVDNEKTVNFSIIKDGFEYPKKEYRTVTGFYSYDRNCDPKILFLVFSSFDFGKDLEVYEAIIPKGSEYIKEGSQFCSNKLKLIKKIC